MPRNKIKSKQFQWSNFFIGIVFLLLFLYFKSNLKESNNYRFNLSENDLLYLENDTISNSDIKINFHKWVNYDNVEFSAPFNIQKQDFISSNYYRNSLVINYYEDDSYYGEQAMTKKYYGQLYYKLFVYDSGFMNRVFLVYDKLKERYQPNYVEFAELIVSSVQYIPYVLLLDPLYKRCSEENGESECVETRFGLHSPSEFVYTFEGDCDTRVLFLYTILKRYGYDVTFLLSNKLRHAILGIDLPIGKSFVKYNGIKYRVWETTNTGWEPGVFPNNSADLSSFFVVNINEYDYGK